LTPLLNVGSLVIGIAILYWGAEWLIRGSAGIARTFGVKPLVVGLTVVAYGTSAPELAVSTKAALTGHNPIALGTVIGSCAANISLILGLTALISPPTVDGRIIRREVPVLVGSAIAVPILFRNGVLSRFEGFLLVACAVVFTIATLTVAARLDPDDELSRDPAEDDHAASSSNLAAMRAENAEDSGASIHTASPYGDAASASEVGLAIGGKGRPRASRLATLVMSGFGVILLVLGSNFFVRGGRGIAAEVGMSERMLGLTVIAIGTALPELIGSIVAATRGYSALAVGSVIGSNLLNVFLVLGVTASLHEIRLGERMHLVDLIGLVVITLLGVFVLRGSRKITRFEGAILVLAYVAFIVCCALF
jgi:cation:H+ antiporter